MASGDARTAGSQPAIVLLILLAALAAGQQAQSPPGQPQPSAAERQLAEAEARKDWTAALAAAQRLLDAAGPQDIDRLYTMARLHALAGHRDEAIGYLQRVHDAGLFSVQQVRRDEAFASLRDDEAFKKVTQAIWLKGYLWILERPERDAYQQPERVMQALAFRAGERVADVGAGSGYFTRRIARAVGPGGIVWAIDIGPEILAVLDERVRQEGLANVRLHHVGPDDPQLPAGGVDTILMVDMLHYVKQRDAYVRTLRGGLAAGRRVVVIDFVPKPLAERPWGPPPEQHMSREDVDAAMAGAGLVPSRVHGFLTEQFFVEYRAK